MGALEIGSDRRARGEQFVFSMSDKSLRHSSTRIGTGMPASREGFIAKFG
jgi:hypothetical protein